jgi:hypothetical protein
MAGDRPVTLIGKVGAVVSFSVVGLAGVQWLMQPVSVPLIGLLVVTFVPTHELIQAVRAPLKKIRRKYEPDT